MCDNNVGVRAAELRYELAETRQTYMKQAQLGKEEYWAAESQQNLLGMSSRQSRVAELRQTRIAQSYVQQYCRKITTLTVGGMQIADKR